MSFKDLLTPESRKNISRIYLKQLYNWVDEIHQEKVNSICNKIGAWGFKYRGSFYSFGGNSSTDVNPLPLNYREEFQKHLDLIQLLEIDKNEIEWFMANLLGQAPDRATIQKLLSDLQIGRSISGNSDIIGITWTDEEVAKFKKDNEKYYQMIAGVTLNKVLASDL